MIKSLLKPAFWHIIPTPVDLNIEPKLGYNSSLFRISWSKLITKRKWVTINENLENICRICALHYHLSIIFKNFTIPGRYLMWTVPYAQGVETYSLDNCLAYNISDLGVKCSYSAPHSSKVPHSGKMSYAAREAFLCLFLALCVMNIGKIYHNTYHNSLAVIHLKSMQSDI